jgi:hypothetical protein
VQFKEELCSKSNGEIVTMNTKSQHVWFVAALVVSLQLLMSVSTTARQQYKPKLKAVNVNVDFRGDICIITYDLNAPSDQLLEISASLVKEGDPTFRIPVRSATGHIGTGKFGGQRRQIRWEWRKDLPAGFTGGPEYSIAFDVRSLTGESWRFFSRPDFVRNRFGIDLTYYGSGSTENSYSRMYLSPLMLTMSYAVLPNFSLQVSYTRLAGDYKLKIPVTKSVSNLLLHRQRLWGDGMASSGLGFGVCYRFWWLRVGTQVTEFIGSETDLSPTEAVMFSGDLYVTQRVYFGIAAIAPNHAGLVSPLHVGTSYPSEDQGVAREGFGSPLIIVFRIGADVL